MICHSGLVILCQGNLLWTAISAWIKRGRIFGNVVKCPLANTNMPFDALFTCTSLASVCLLSCSLVQRSDLCDLRVCSWYIVSAKTLADALNLARETKAESESSAAAGTRTATAEGTPAAVTAAHGTAAAETAAPTATAEATAPDISGSRCNNNNTSSSSKPGQLSCTAETTKFEAGAGIVSSDSFCATKRERARLL